MTVSRSLSAAPETAPVPTDAGRQRLAELFSPCFALVLNLRATDSLGDPEALRRRIKGLFDRIERAALSAGVGPEEVRAAKFALVAFIDETILSSEWAGTGEWMNTPLQLELYDQFDAGEVFFDRVQAFLREPDARNEVLEVYYLCMALGFKGKYQLKEQERLRELIETTAETLPRHSGSDATTLAPHGQPRDQATAEVRSKVPAWVIAAAAALVGGLIYAGMYLYVSASARTVASTIQQLGGG